MYTGVKILAIIWLICVWVLIYYGIDALCQMINFPHTNLCFTVTLLTCIIGSIYFALNEEE